MASNYLSLVLFGTLALSAGLKDKIAPDLDRKDREGTVDVIIQFREGQATCTPDWKKGRCSGQTL